MDQPRPRLDAEFLQEHWIRLYRPGPWRAMALFIAAIACVLLATSASVIMVTGRTIGERLVLAAIGILVAGGGLWLTGRWLASGVWIRDAGVRINSVRRSTILTWQEVQGIQDVGRALTLNLHDGRTIPTGMSSRSLDFLARPEAYEIAATALTDWHGAHRK